MPQRELISGESIEARCLLGLDQVLEVVDSVIQRDLDREGGRFAFDKTEQVQVVVGHGVVKGRKVGGDGREKKKDVMES